MRSPSFLASFTGSHTSSLLLCLGFDYNFNAIQNEENELFNAYKDMFEIAVSQSQNLRQVLTFYVPIYDRLFVGFSFQTSKT